MIVYHGSTQKVTSPDFLHSRSDIDFGVGFYLTRDKRMAETWAANKDTSVCNIYDLNTDGLNIVNLGLSQQWLDFVAYNRGFSNKVFDVGNVDIIIGPTADDKMFNAVMNYLSGAITAQQAIKYINVAGFSKQIVLKTERALENLTFLESREITGYQKDILVNNAKMERIEANNRLTEMLMKDSSKSKIEEVKLINEDSKGNEDNDYGR